MKSFLNAVLFGAATYLGFEVAKKGIEIAKDPYKRTNVKRAVQSVKDAITKKTES